MYSSELAILGGPKAFLKAFQEKWQRPKDKEKKLINTLIDRDELSGSGFGISLDFEQAFASYIGCQYCLSFSHGTAALMAAYFAAGIGPGDEVLTPAVGYIASYSGAIHMGARPIFCDIDPSSLLINPQEIQKKISLRTKAINITDLNGRICDLDKILSLANHKGIPVVEDASHAHGGYWNKKKIGNFSHATCFSLQGVNPMGKAVAGGEGGVVCTNDQDIYQAMLAYCQLHRKNIKQELHNSPFEVLDSEVLGLKWRAHPLALAIALVSLESLDFRNQCRTDNACLTQDALKDFSFISFPLLKTEAKVGGFYGGLKVIYNPSQLNNLPFSTFIQSLIEEGVPIISVGVGSCEYRRTLAHTGFDLWGEGRGPLGPAWQGLEPYRQLDKKNFPIAEEMDQRVFTLPSFIHVENEYYDSLKRAFEKIHSYYQKII